MQIGIPKETFPGERRVAMVPGVIPTLRKLGLDVVIERGAGDAAGFPDQSYLDAATLGSRADVFQSDIVAQVRTVGSNAATGQADLPLLRSGQAVIGFADPLTAQDAARAVAERGALLFSMELVPRIT